MRRTLLILVAIGVAVGVQRSCAERAVLQPPGMIAPDEPEQSSLTRADARSFEFEGFQLAPQAGYRLSARLLGRKHYRLGREAELSPVDFALGWGAMSDTAVLDALDIGQSGRFFWVRWASEPPIPPKEIFLSAANTHLIPADDTVRAALDRMRPGQVVHLQGLLVNASTADGWRWNSSLVRSDQGAGACELFWVSEAWIDNESKT
ncbi:MAG: hypothetical protein M3O62_08845 [Pseudomonadota bacterium]|nr:hypothetical protein [Pseudomonadota bacterium]